ncbi:hypothetical protein [Nostoc sp.]|uniref:hypothetical protein n=1 Tax=Nostoc sp. TaxID=1180 RepID=UPI002FF4FAD4
MVGTLDRVIVTKNQLQALADIFSNKVDMLDLMQGRQSYVVNAKIDFKIFKYQYPAVMQSIENICN